MQLSPMPEYLNLVCSIQFKENGFVDLFSILGDELFSLLEGSVPFREEDGNVVEGMGKPSHEYRTLFAW